MANLKLRSNPNNSKEWEELCENVNNLIQAAGFGSTNKTRTEEKEARFGTILDRTTSRKNIDWRPLYEELANLLAPIPHWNLTLRGKPNTEISVPEYENLPLLQTTTGNVELSISSGYPTTEHRALGKISNWNTPNTHQTLNHPMFLQPWTTTYGKVLTGKQKYTLTEALEIITQGKILRTDLEPVKNWTHHHYAATRINNEQILGIPGTVNLTQLELATLGTAGIHLQTNEPNPNAQPWRSHLDTSGDTLIQIDDTLRGSLWGI